MVRTYSILRKLRARELKGNLKNYISVILIVLLSVALFTGLSSNHLKLQEEKDQVYTDSNMGDLFVTTKGYSSNEELEKDENYLSNISNDLSKRLYTSATYNKASIVLAAYDNKNVSHESSIIEGNDGILVFESLALDFKLKVGDTIKIYIA